MLMPIKKSKSYGIWLVIGICLIVLGVAILLLTNANGPAPSGTSALNYIKSSANANSKPAQTDQTISGIPTKIELPSVGIYLSVLPGYYDSKTKTWTLSLTNAHYAAVSAPANNQSGLTFIYGHNRSGVFSNLAKINPGDQAKITTDNQHVFIYTYRSNTTVAPTDTSLFNYSGKPILVVQTCSGEFFQNRQLFVFDFEAVR